MISGHLSDLISPKGAPPGPPSSHCPPVSARPPMAARGMGAEGTPGLLSLLIREGTLAKGVRLLTSWGEEEGTHGDSSQQTQI